MRRRTDGGACAGGGERGPGAAESAAVATNRRPLFSAPPRPTPVASPPPPPLPAPHVALSSRPSLPLNPLCIVAAGRALPGSSPSTRFRPDARFLTHSPSPHHRDLGHRRREQQIRQSTGPSRPCSPARRSFRTPDARKQPIFQPHAEVCGALTRSPLRLQCPLRGATSLDCERSLSFRAAGWEAFGSEAVC